MAALSLAAALGFGSKTMKNPPLSFELSQGKDARLRAALVNRSTEPVAFLHAHPANPCVLTLKGPDGRAVTAVDADPEERPPQKAAWEVLAPGMRKVLHEESFVGPNREGGYALPWGALRFMGERFGLRAGVYRAKLTWEAAAGPDAPPGARLWTGSLSSQEVEVRVGKKR